MFLRGQLRLKAILAAWVCVSTGSVKVEKAEFLVRHKRSVSLLVVRVLEKRQWMLLRASQAHE